MNERECTLEDAREALDFVSPEEGRKEWMEIAFALRSEFGDQGFDLFDAWSSQGSTYKNKEMPGVWRSAKSAGANGTVGIGTLFKRAIDNGFKFKSRTEEERERFQAEAERRRIERQAEEAAEQTRIKTVQAGIAELCQVLWTDHLVDNGASPYLVEKGVANVWRPGIRFGRHSVVAWAHTETGRWGLVNGGAAIAEFYDSHKRGGWTDENPAPYSFRHIRPNVLAIPLVDGEGRLWNLQFIYPTGTKTTLRDSRKQGLFHLIGDPPAPSSEVRRLWVAEGFSTAASVAMAMSEPVAMAVDAGNLMPVAQTLRGLYPWVELCFAADNDAVKKDDPPAPRQALEIEAALPHNTGVIKARAAAAAVGGRVVIPDFSQVGARAHEEIAAECH